MPNTDDLKARAAARELRKQKREAAVVAAHDQDVAGSAKQQENEVVREKAKAAELDRLSSGRPAPAKPAKPKRADVTRAAKAAHERDAAVDARRVPDPVDVGAEFEKWSGQGTPPLHVLNALASSIDAEARDAGKDIAQAAGKAAYETYVGKIAGNRNRHARMRAQIAAGEAKLATKKPEASE
jgi:hypothetical protein